MKKNFFKKLSFVLALAMIISVINPAAGAFAAAKAPKLNATSRTLFLKVPGQDNYDFNVSNKQSGWKYAWKSKDTKVATVNAKNGVTTAKAAGKTTVSVAITDKNGKKVKTLSASILVRDNIKELTITNTPKDDKLAVNEANDFNRSYVTVAGLKKGSQAVTRWTVDKEGATIDDKGVFVATEAGKYTITANAFQSNAKYKEWLKDNTKNVTATASYEVTVYPSVVETNQIDTTSFEVKFDSDMSKTDLATEAKLYQIINGKQVATSTEKIEKITFDETGKVATIKLYVSFIPKTVYHLVYGDLVAEFTAASTDVADIKGLVFGNVDVNVEDNGTDLLNYVYAVNDKGVKIIAGKDLSNYLTFTYEGELSDGFVSSHTIYMHKVGTSAPVTVKYFNYVYNEATKVYDNVEYVAKAMAFATKVNKDIDTASIQFAALAPDSTEGPDKDSSLWGTTVKVPAEEAFNLYARYKTNDNHDSYVNAKADLFTYTASNTDKLIISGNNMYAAAMGDVTVIVKNSDGVVVGTFTVQILAKRSFVSATPDKTGVVVGNNLKYGEQESIIITLKDSMGDILKGDVKKVDLVKGPATVENEEPLMIYPVNAIDDNKQVIKVPVDAKNKQAGPYVYKITITALGADKEVLVNVNVGDSKSVKGSVAVDYRLRLSTTSVDLKEKISEDVKIEVYGVNTAGFAVAQLDAKEYAIKINNVSENNTKFVAEKTGNYAFIATVSGAALEVNGTKKPVGAYLGNQTLNVKDSTSYDIHRNTTVVKLDDARSVLGIADKAFELKLNGNKVTATKVVYSVGGKTATAEAGKDLTLTGATDLYIDSIIFTSNGDGDKGREYTFNIKSTIAVR